MEFKNLPLLDLKIDMDRRTFDAYAAVFGNIDNGDDRVLKGAFRKTIKERLPKKQIKVLRDHYNPLGMPVEMKEDIKGLWAKSGVSKTPFGDATLEYLRDGVYSEMSIGFQTIKYRMVTENENQIRELQELKLYEYGPVLWGMNEQAVVTAVKSLMLKAENNPETISEILQQIQAMALKFTLPEKEDGDTSNEKLILAFGDMNETLKALLKVEPVISTRIKSQQPSKVDIDPHFLQSSLASLQSSIAKMKGTKNV